jgi:hypothetical protein
MPSFSLKEINLFIIISTFLIACCRNFKTTVLINYCESLKEPVSNLAAATNVGILKQTSYYYGVS